MPAGSVTYIIASFSRRSSERYDRWYFAQTICACVAALDAAFKWVLPADSGRWRWLGALEPRKGSNQMACIIDPRFRYRMPVVFGPAPGPRQRPDGGMWTKKDAGRMGATWMTVRYLTDAAELERMCPPGFGVRGDPVVSVSGIHLDRVYWLAGREYDALSVTFPVRYTGRTEVIDGSFCPILWENSPDAIITGREELGFPKLFSDIYNDIDLANNQASTRAAGYGYSFFEMNLYDLQEQLNPGSQFPSGDGPQLYFKYFPRTAPFGREGADSAYVTTSCPVSGVSQETPDVNLDEFQFRRWTASGRLMWNRATFEDLPTTFHIVNGMADLPILDWLDANVVSYEGPGVAFSINEQRAIEPA